MTELRNGLQTSSKGKNVGTFNSCDVVIGCDSGTLLFINTHAIMHPIKLITDKDSDIPRNYHIDPN